MRGYDEYFRISEIPLDKFGFFDYCRIIPFLLRGRLAIVTNVERDAVDADGAFDEQRWMRTAKSCGPDASRSASTGGLLSASDGVKKPDHRGEHEVAVKTIVRGMPGVSGCTRGD